MLQPQQIAAATGATSTRTRQRHCEGAFTTWPTRRTRPALKSPWRLSPRAGARRLLTPCVATGRQQRSAGTPTRAGWGPRRRPFRRRRGFVSGRPLLAPVQSERGGIRHGSALISTPAGFRRACYRPQSRAGPLPKQRAYHLGPWEKEAGLFYWSLYSRCYMPLRTQQQEAANAVAPPACSCSSGTGNMRQWHCQQQQQQTHSTRES